MIIILANRLAKEGELAASGVVYVLIIMPFFDLVISGLGTILENNQESQLLVHVGTAAGEHKVKRIKLKMQRWIGRNFTFELDCLWPGCFITWSTAFYAINGAPHLLFYPAACVALAILAVKAAAMFVPSKEIQRWSVEVSSAEGTFEARGRAEKEPRISIPVPAVSVSELLAGKSQRICNSLN